MSAAIRPSVYTIAPEAAFADALAKGLIDRAGGDPLVLARAQILLPSRRAVRALTDAFVRCADGGLLLPRMTPLGDIDVDDSLDMVAGLETSLMRPIDPIRRRLLLTRLIRRWRDSIGSVEALRLADQLGASFDTLAREGIDPAQLKDVAKDDLASHWLETFAFFELVIEHQKRCDLGHGGSASEDLASTNLHLGRSLGKLGSERLSRYPHEAGTRPNLEAHAAVTLSDRTA